MDKNALKYVGNIRPRLDRRIDLMEPATTRTASGSAKLTYSNARTVWAEVKDGLPDEILSAYRETMVQPTIFTIRQPYGLTLTAKWLIEYNGSTYDIIGINEIGRNRYKQIRAIVRE